MTRHPLLALAAALAAAAAPAPAPVRAEEAPPPKAPTAAEDQAVLERLVEQARPMVEKLRGLEFKRPVPVAPVTREKFVGRYLKDFTRVLGGEERAATASRLLVRLGILAEGTDLGEVLGRFLEGAVAANYDPETGNVSFLPGVPRSLQTMVHELVHALDDQHFDMKAQVASWGGSIDRALAYGALAEGDAQSVEVRFLTGGASAKQPLEQLRAMADGFATAILRQKFGATPPAVVLAFKSQYLEGGIFAEALRRTEKGERAVDDAFRRPPASTEQILHPEKFLAGEAPIALVLPAPPEGAKLLFSTTLGELGSRIVLLAHGVEAKAAAEAAAGWGGDTVALVSFPAGEAVLWTSAWDTEADATAFLECMKAAFPLRTGDPAGRPSRGLVQRGTTVEFVEAPLDCLADAVDLLKRAERK
jgi:hypothetical protein